MATVVKGWKNARRLPGTEEIRWTISPSLKRTLKEGREEGVHVTLKSKYNLPGYTGIQQSQDSKIVTLRNISTVFYQS